MFFNPNRVLYVLSIPSLTVRACSDPRTIPARIGRNPAPICYTSVMSRPVGRVNPQNVPTLQARVSPRNPAGPFADLTWPQQRAAEAWLFKFCQRWGSDLPPWRRAILIGTAKRLALHPPAANFGHALKAAKGGRAIVRKCKAAGVMMPGAITLRAWKKAGRPALPSRQLEV